MNLPPPDPLPKCPACGAWFSGEHECMAQLRAEVRALAERVDYLEERLRSTNRREP